MKAKLWLARCLRKYRTTQKLLALYDLAKPSSYLEQVGWYKSVSTGMAVDAEGRPIPWMTYPSIAFIANRLTSTMAVFEFGSGNSTLWWASRVERVVACEHDRAWYERMSDSMPANVEYLYAPLGSAYWDSICEHGQSFDIVVLDGRERVKCCHRAIDALKDDGVVIWDNSDRDKYQPGYEMLSAAGFRRMDFVGMGPINSYAWSTSLFYRTSNCLGI